MCFNKIIDNSKKWLSNTHSLKIKIYYSHLIINRRGKIIKYILKSCIWTLLGISILLICFLCFSPSLPIKLPQSNQTISFMMIGRAPVAYIPFQEIDQLGFWLNIIMTCPLGIFTYILFSSKFKISHVIATGILIGFTIEFIQFITDNLAITHRWVDINDVLANALGFVIGYYLSKLIDK